MSALNKGESYPVLSRLSQEIWNQKYFSSKFRIILFVLETMQQQQNISPFKRLMNLFLSRKYEDCLKFLEAVRGSEVMDAAQLTILEVGCWTHLGIKHDEGNQMLTELIQKNPKNSFAFYGLGLNLYMNGKFEESLHPFTRALELNPMSMQRAAVYKEQAAKIASVLKDGN